MTTIMSRFIRVASAVLVRDNIHTVSKYRNTYNLHVDSQNPNLALCTSIIKVCFEILTKSDNSYDKLMTIVKNNVGEL